MSKQNCVRNVSNPLTNWDVQLARLARCRSSSSSEQKREKDLELIFLSQRNFFLLSGKRNRGQKSGKKPKNIKKSQKNFFHFWPKNKRYDGMAVGRGQCDHIRQIFVTLAKIYSCLAIFWMFIKYLAKLYVILLWHLFYAIWQKFTVVKAQYWQNNIAVGSHWWTRETRKNEINKKNERRERGKTKQVRERAFEWEERARAITDNFVLYRCS